MQNIFKMRPLWLGVENVVLAAIMEIKNKTDVHYGILCQPNQKHFFERRQADDKKRYRIVFYRYFGALHLFFLPYTIQVAELQA